MKYLWITAFFISFFLILSCGKNKNQSNEKRKNEAEIIHPNKNKTVSSQSQEVSSKSACFKKIWGPVRISSTSATPYGLSGATGVGQVGVTWIEPSLYTSNVYFARISSEGTVQKIPVTKKASAYAPTDTAWTGRDFAIAWGDDRQRRIEIFTARVSPTGKISSGARQFTFTRPVKEGDIYSSDSSKEPALLNYNENLLIVWGGPGDRGRQQMYHSIVSKKGKALYEPYELTKGPFDHGSFRLAPVDGGVAFLFCVNPGGENQIWRGIMEGIPPKVTSFPSMIAATKFFPCQPVEIPVAGKNLIMWVEKAKESGLEQTGNIKIVSTLPSGELGAASTVNEVTIVNYRAKLNAGRPFDAVSTGKHFAIAWTSPRTTQGEKIEEEKIQNIDVGIFSEAGEKLCEPYRVDAPGLFPDDPRILYSGFEKRFIIVWTDRLPGEIAFSVEVEGIEISFNE